MQTVQEMALTKSLDTTTDGDPTGRDGDKATNFGNNQPKNRSDKRRKRSLRINTVRCGIVMIILLVMFTPLIVSSFPFPWTTEQVNDWCTLHKTDKTIYPEHLSINILIACMV